MKTKKVLVKGPIPVEKYRAVPTMQTIYVVDSSSEGGYRSMVRCAINWWVFARGLVYTDAKQAAKHAKSLGWGGEVEPPCILPGESFFAPCKADRKLTGEVK